MPNDKSMDDLISPRGDKVSELDSVLIERASKRSPPDVVYAPLNSPKIEYPERVLTKWVVDDTLGTGTLVGKTPQERELIKKIQDGIDEMRREGMIVDPGVEPNRSRG